MSAPCGLASVRAWACPVPMPNPVRLGPIVYRTREYAVLALRTEDGFEGRAISYTRGTPLVPALRTLAEALDGVDCGDPAAVQQQLSRRFLPGWAQFLRAASLLDVALWDVAAKRAGLPLHRYLGATATEVPLMVVTGYFADRRSPEELVAEAVGFADSGFERTKLILGGHDLEADCRLAAAMRAALGPEASIGIDFHARWRNAAEAESYCRPLLEHRPRFVEDPFPSTGWRALAELAERVPGLPLAAGEDTTSLAAFEELLLSARYLRCDATASGGISGALDAAGLAEAAGARVVPHVFPYVHAPLCAALDVVANAEVIDADTGADPWEQLLERPPPIADGVWRLGEEPGIELPLDFDRIGELAVDGFELRLGDAL